MAILVQLNPIVQIEKTSDYIDLSLEGSTRKRRINNLRPALIELINSLKHKNLAVVEHVKSISTVFRDENVLNLLLIISRLEESGFFIYKYVLKDKLLFTLEPNNYNYTKTQKVKPNDLLLINEDFNLTIDNDSRFLIDIPFSESTIKIYNKIIFEFIDCFRVPETIESLKNFENIDSEDIIDWATMFLNAGVLKIHSDSEKIDCDLNQRIWGLIDLNFHYRTRRGFHKKPNGATWRGKNMNNYPKNAIADKYLDTIKLIKPTHPKNQPGFFNIIEKRKSKRSYSQGSLLNQEEISRLLWYSFREKSIIHKNDVQDDYTHRPVASGGAIHELEIFLLINKMSDLAKGLYHYDPKGHKLGVIQTDISEPARKILRECSESALMDKGQHPHVVIIIAADYGKLAYKYEGVTYALILKHAGVLIQQLYLVSTAIELAPSAIGCGDSKAFSDMSGFDIKNVTSVAEFILGPLAEEEIATNQEK